VQRIRDRSPHRVEDLRAKAQRRDRVPAEQVQEERLKYLTDEHRIKAVTVLFSDLEGRLHMLDYDKKFLLKSWDNLTFDGSSIRGFTAQRESDLRLGIDWGAFYWAPADVFGAGKVLVFGEVIAKDGKAYSADIRGVLKNYADGLFRQKGYTLNAANEIQGFLFKGTDAERHYHETQSFEYVNTGGYYHSLPGDPLRTFIDSVAEVQRAMGFENANLHLGTKYHIADVGKDLRGRPASWLHVSASMMVNAVLEDWSAWKKAA